MKPSLSAALGLLTILTVVSAASAETAPSLSVPLDSEPSVSRLSDLPMHLNPQIGVSNFEYSAEGSSKPKLAGGATVEFGLGTYKAETGILVIQQASQAQFKGQTTPSLIESKLLAIPLMAKIRIYASPVQSWALKLGVIQTYELSSNKTEATNKIDSLGSLGLSGRLAFLRNADFLIEASSNRGLVPALRMAHDDTYSEGVLVLAGVSFRL